MTDTFYCIERSNNDPWRPGYKVFERFPLGATLWERADASPRAFPWTDNIKEAKQYGSRWTADLALTSLWCSDPALKVTEHAWVSDGPTKEDQHG